MPKVNSDGRVLNAVNRRSMRAKKKAQVVDAPGADLVHRQALNLEAAQQGQPAKRWRLRQRLRYSVLRVLAVLTKPLSNQVSQRFKRSAKKWKPKRSNNDVTATLKHLFPAEGAEAFFGVSDGEFILYVAEVLFEERGAHPAQIEAYKRWLQEDPIKRVELVLRSLSDHIIRRSNRFEPAANDPDKCHIMGTDRFISSKDWGERKKEVTLASIGNRRLPPLSERCFEHSGEYVVSAIASLYKGKQFLEAFLDNIVTQSMFSQSELIILDAKSPEGEYELIREYQRVYPNIIYHRYDYRIGIYDAWNEGVRLSRGRYLTNVNLDDLRRVDSFELQATALDEYENIDVVYQDFYYSFDSNFDFRSVEAMGFKSDLPIVTPGNLLCYNAPHNAPMWRKQIHADVGLFDTTFRSAGDYEMWLRCISYGKQFLKLNEPHVAYFQNPDGISTSSESRGVIESRIIRNKYSSILVSPFQTMSRKAFASALGVPLQWSADTKDFDTVTIALRNLRQKFEH